MASLVCGSKEYESLIAERAVLDERARLLALIDAPTAADEALQVECVERAKAISKRLDASILPRRFGNGEAPNLSGSRSPSYEGAQPPYPSNL